MRFIKAAAAIAAALLACAPIAAATLPISQMPLASSLGAGDKIAAVQGSGCATGVSPCSNVAATPAQIATFVATAAPLAAAFQPLDSDLTSIAALSTTSFGRSLLAQADAPSTRSTLGLAIGTNVQAYNLNLSALAGLTTAADQIPYWTGSGTAATASAPAYGRSLLAASSAAGARNLLGTKRAIPTGRYMIADGINAGPGGTNVAPGSTTLRYSIGYVREAVTVSSLSFRVITAAASGNCQISIYATDSASLLAAGAPLVTTAAMSTATAGAVETTGLSIAIGPGYYAFATLCDTNGGTAVFVNANSTVSDQVRVIGSATSLGALTASSAVTGLAKSATYPTWPTLTGSFSGDSLADVATQSIPVVAFKG